jgi:hypothetical protein
MDCFDNLIGIHRNCGETTPSSNLYIQDLPGITLSVANFGMDEETISGLKMIQSRITHAQNAIVAHIRNQVADKIRLNSVIQNDSVGYYQTNLRTVASEAGKLKGITVKITQHPYMEFYISRLWLKLASIVTTKIYVYDLMTDTKLDEFDVTTVAKTPVSVLVNKGYLTNKQRLHLFIGIDASLADTYETSISKANCYSCSGGVYSNPYISFGGASIDSASQKIDSNLSSNNGTNGLSFEYSLNCSVEPFICNMGGVLAWSLLHKAGAEIMKELIASRRLNSIVTIDRGTNESLRDEYEAEYMASMSGILNNIQLPNDICFRCNSKLRKAVAIP